MARITADGGGQRSDFCRAALENLRKRAEGHAKQHPPLRHMLVLPEGEILLVPPRSGCHLPGYSSYHVPPAVAFGTSQVAAVLPPPDCWPPDLKPIRAVVAEQEFVPYRPLAQRPYRVHLFFGDVAGMAQLQSLAADLVNLGGDVERAISGGHAGAFFHSNDCIHNRDAEILDAWLCTVHWWAWKATDSPIHTRPYVVLGGSAVAANYMDQAVAEKLSFSALDCDVFTATAATIDLFFRFFTVPPGLPWAADYPPVPKPQEPLPDAERAKTQAPAEPGPLERDSKTSPTKQSSAKGPPSEAITTDTVNISNWDQGGDAFAKSFEGMLAKVTQTISPPTEPEPSATGGKPAGITPNPAPKGEVTPAVPKGLKSVFWTMEQAADAIESSLSPEAQGLSPAELKYEEFLALWLTYLHLRAWGLPEYEQLNPPEHRRYFKWLVSKGPHAMFAQIEQCKRAVLQADCDHQVRDEWLSIIGTDDFDLVKGFPRRSATVWAR